MPGYQQKRGYMIPVGKELKSTFPKEAVNLDIGYIKNLLQAPFAFQEISQYLHVVFDLRRIKWFKFEMC